MMEDEVQHDSEAPHEDDEHEPGGAGPRKRGRHRAQLSDRGRSNPGDRTSIARRVPTPRDETTRLDTEPQPRARRT